MVNTPQSSDTTFVAEDKPVFLVVISVCATYNGVAKLSLCATVRALLTSVTQVLRLIVGITPNVLMVIRGYSLHTADAWFTR